MKLTKLALVLAAVLGGSLVTVEGFVIIACGLKYLAVI
jgi:hypothetical protein